MRLFILAAALLVVGAACSGSDDGVAASTAATTAAASTSTAPSTAATTSTAPATIAGAGVSQTGYAFPPAPAVPSGPASPELAADLDALAQSLTGTIDVAAIERIGAGGDARAAWFLSDLLRFVQIGEAANAAVVAFEDLTGADISADDLSRRSAWQSVTNHLFAWDLPAHPDYVQWKRIPFEIVEPRWEPFFADEDAAIDWRYVSWGGVLIDDRVFGDQLPCPRGCIPALDDPAVTPAAAGGWYPDDGIVFGLVVNGEARAYPKNMMEIHEMINDEIGARRVAIPYCTLCGSAQAYFTDDVPGREAFLVFRTSGLLTRSNKVMYELESASVFDTFRGVALSGPLQDLGVVLQQTSIVTSTWGEWKAAHPETTILAEDGGIGRVYPSDPLRGRDDAGPIFPIGDVDPRLPAQTQVLGVIAPDGTPVAFPADLGRAELAAGASVELAGVVLVADGGGVRAITGDGADLVGHQAFWFAWSQFHPDTLVWTPLG